MLIKDNSDEWVLRSDWYIEDIQNQANDQGIELTDDECLEIMGNIAKSFDANHGINWDVINCHIDMFIDKRDAK